MSTSSQASLARIGATAPFHAPPFGRRRSDRAPEMQPRLWALEVLDEIDYGVIVLGAGSKVLHLNHRARVELTRGGVLRLDGRRVKAADDDDDLALAGAVAEALTRGMRRIVTLGAKASRTCIGVVPLARDAPGAEAFALLLTERASVCEALSVHWFARQHDLSPTESRILKALCQGQRPADVALANGVKLSTVRTQIAALRLKTGYLSVPALVRAVARLPPLMNALRMVA